MSLPLPKQLEDELKNVPRYKPEKFSIEKLLESHESGLFDEVFGSQSHRPRVSSTSGQTLEESRSSTEFTTVLTARLADAERENKDMRRQLAVASKEIIQLREERDHFSDMLEQSNDQASLIKKLKSDNVYLHKQLLEMEQFLADYGLVWVGSSQDTTEQIDKVSDHMNQMNIDYDHFVKKVAELNAMILNEPTQVVTQVDGNLRRARLAHPEEIFEHIDVTLYRNGLMVKRGPFRPVGSDSYDSFVRDIIDGYFPSEFRGASPDGVLLKLLDRRNDNYTAEASIPCAGDALSEARFLDRLPKTIVKNGHIVCVRGDVEAKMTSRTVSQSEAVMASSYSESKLPHGGASPAGGYKTDMDSSNRSHSSKRVHNVITYAHRAIESAARTGREELPDDICTVQVKWPNGKDVFIVKMFASDTVEDLKTVINDFLLASARDTSSPVLPDYSADTIGRMIVHSSHPRRALSDDVSLRQAHLNPNGTVHIQLLST